MSNKMMNELDYRCGYLSLTRFDQVTKTAVLPVSSHPVTVTSQKAPTRVFEMSRTMSDSALSHFKKSPHIFAT